MIYTSGSTGAPKAVTVPHGQVVRLLRATQDWYRFDERDGWTLFHSFAFDFSVWELWGALAHGGRLVVVPHWQTPSPEDFPRLLALEEVTVLNQTPAAFRQLVAAYEERPEEISLRYVIFGGDALDVDSVRRWSLMPARELNVPGSDRTAWTSSYRAVTQKPGPSGSGCQVRPGRSRTAASRSRCWSPAKTSGRADRCLSRLSAPRSRRTATPGSSGPRTS
ncbi:AMP-binding protein [Streptomyces albidoflavus]